MRIFLAILSLFCFIYVAEAGFLDFIINASSDIKNKFKTEFDQLISKTKFNYYEWKNNKNVTIDKTALQANRNLKIVVHGFHNTEAGWAWSMMYELLKKDNDIYVMIVDWKGPGLGFVYWPDADNTVKVGDKISEEIKSVKKPFSSIHCIGHSLGSHICGFASSKYNKFDRISALDPAGPHFYQKPINQRLDPTDAKFVDAYHTNDGDGISSGCFGYMGTIGHADFIVNGGYAQNGCGHYEMSKNLENLSNNKKIVGCSHSRAYEYYIESIKNANCFVACSTDTDCKSSVVHFGYKTPSTAKGNYYTKTGDKTPYCLP